MNSATPLELATQELPAAVDAIGAGDENATTYARSIRKLVSDANNASVRARSTAEQLHADDVMNPQGKARKLAEIPAELMAATAEQLDQADLDLDTIAGIHLAAILEPALPEGSVRDELRRNDTNASLREELHNFAAGLTKETAVVRLVELAADTRYSVMLAGPLGRSLAARFGFDAAILRKVALEALAVNGTDDQVRRSKALAAIPAARRVIGLARGAAQAVAEESQRPPAPAPSQAMF